MEIIFLSLTILVAVFGSTGMVLYYYHRFFGKYIIAEREKKNPAEQPLPPIPSPPQEVQVVVDNKPAAIVLDKAYALRQKQLDTFAEITRLAGDVKAILEYTSGEETLRQWKQRMEGPLREMLRRSYEWAVFLPQELQDLPSRYASQLMRSLVQLDTVNRDEISTYAAIFNDIREIERVAAEELLRKIRGSLDFTERTRQHSPVAGTSLDNSQPAQNAAS